MPLSKRQRERPLSFVDKFVIAWMIMDGLTHLGMEAGYLVLALGETAKRSDTFNGAIWREYGKADLRWAVRDAPTICIELITVVLVGPLCLWLAWAVKERKAYRHILQATVCVCELYGGWMTFGPEWVEGSPNLVTNNWVYMWIYLVFMNGLWVVLPAVLLWHSIVRIAKVC